VRFFDLGFVPPVARRSARALLVLALPVACTETPTEVMVPGDGTASSTGVTTTSSASASSDSSGVGTEAGTTMDPGDSSTSGTEETSDTEGTTTGGVCGDGILDPGEACDMDELGGADCVGQGQTGGTLACDKNCAFDVSGCYLCGDGNIDLPEQCDGANLGGEDCASQGFDDGGLSCDALMCTFDTSSCYECGDGNIDPGEVCDGANLDGQGCGDQGFDGGTLACDALMCTFDTSSCYVCGDGAIDPGEVCDLADLGGEDCISQGFDAGTLACSGTCIFDTSMCESFACGNSVIDGADECDGIDLGGETCESQGFPEGGTLDCNGGCTFDTSACCGDGNVGMGEICDGPPPPGATCVDEGFDGGIIDCASNCMMLDTSGCFFCGDGTANPGEDCDQMDLNGGTCGNQGFDGGILGCSGACTYDTSACFVCGDNTIDPGEICDGTDLGGETCESQMLGFTGGVLGCEVVCDGFDTTGCTSLPRPIAGEVVISEIMKDSFTVADDSGGEWIELHNPGGVTYQLGGCTLDIVGSGDSVMIDSDLVSTPGSYLGLAEGSGGGPGFAADFEWPLGALPLPDTADEIQLNCDGITVDSVSYDDGVSFPDTEGTALNLDPLHLNTVDNDVGANWCDAIDNYNGDLGTPGAPNTACPETIDFCALQFPTTIIAVQNTIETVYGRLFIAGLTDVNMAGNDPSGAVLAGVGYGPDGSDPAVDPTWVWTDAMPNPGWNGAGAPNNDEYQADLQIPAPGTYDYAYRFSGDFGATFTYCDVGAGSSDGYDPADAGAMTSNP